MNEVEKQSGRVQSHFLDSGAFTLRTKANEYAKANDCSCWNFYDTQEHWDYLDSYAKFVKEHQIAIDLYANVDAIPNPEITWRNQKYLEDQHGLNPVPVVHYKTNLKWLRRYMKSGYDLIGLGGLVGSIGKKSCRRWLDEVFDLTCSGQSRLPQVKIHGFGVTSHSALVCYPWWSVDSVSWAKVGGFGGILVPRWKAGKFQLDFPPRVITVSKEAPSKRRSGLWEDSWIEYRSNHYWSMRKEKQEEVHHWLKDIGISLGRVENGEEVERGVLTCHTDRRAACLLYFEKLREWLPEWPWPFLKQSRESHGFGLEGWSL